MTYMNAEMELVTFAAEDVLATSATEAPVVTTQGQSCGGGEDVIMPTTPTRPRG